MPEFDPSRDVVDPDVDVHDPAQRADRGRRELHTLGAIAIGGVIGAEARYGLATAVPHTDAAWPWSTLMINLIGSLLIGVLMTVVALRSPHHLLRPFAGVGVLGGFTTFSTFALDNQHLLRAGRPFVALGYSAASLFGCFAVTAVAVVATRRLVEGTHS